MLMKDYVFLQSFVIGSYLAFTMKSVPLCSPSACHLSLRGLCKTSDSNVALRTASERQRTN